MRRIMLIGMKWGTIAVVAMVAVSTSQAATRYVASNLKGVFAFQLHGQTSFAPFFDGSSGKTNSGIATVPRQDIMRCGVFTCDGKSNLVGRTIATTDDGISTVVIDYNWKGLFTISTNGLGTITIHAPTNSDINSCKTGDGTPQGGCAAFEGVETYVFVISGSTRARSIILTETDNAGGGAKIFLTGAAWTQNTQHASSSGGSSFPFPF
jgi:hypothetical protein